MPPKKFLSCVLGTTLIGGIWAQQSTFNQSPPIRANGRSGGPISVDPTGCGQFKAAEYAFGGYGRDAVVGCHGAYCILIELQNTALTIRVVNKN